MSEIKLESRYPESRHEDITDAYMRGYESGYNDSAVHYELEHCPACKNIADLQEALEENAKLRKLIEDLQVAPCCGSECWMKLSDRMREVGVEVKS